MTAFQERSTICVPRGEGGEYLGLGRCGESAAASETRTWRYVHETSLLAVDAIREVRLSRRRHFGTCVWFHHRWSLQSRSFLRMWRGYIAIRKCSVYLELDGIAPNMKQSYTSRPTRITGTERREREEIIYDAIEAAGCFLVERLRSTRAGIGPALCRVCITISVLFAGCSELR